MQNIILVGNSGSGKTSFLRHLNDEPYTESYISTIGKDMKIIEHENKKYIIHDTAGQERFQSLSSAFYRGADCCCMVYDITNE